MFQSTPAYGGRHFKGGNAMPVVVKFQSTPAYGGRLYVTANSLNADVFQSTPAYGGRPSTAAPRTMISGVSIHARVRRATSTAHHLRTRMRVSIHARVRRATIGTGAITHVVMFQSTPAYGGRPGQGPATAAPRNGFNPRPRTAGDAQACRVFHYVKQFQSTPAYGGRHRSIVHFVAGHDVSIHARVRRATTRGWRLGDLAMFQSTPAYGGRRLRSPRRRQPKSFNPRPRTAGDSFHRPFCSGP